MSYENLLTDRCDIYHLQSRNKQDSKSFGVPVDDYQEEFYYGDTPDSENVKCYFVEKNQSVTQQDPNKRIIETYRVHFLPSTDIRTNDKVVWDGATYKAQKPRKIKNHHIEVTVVRNDNL